MVCRTGFTGAPTREILRDRDDAEARWDGLMKAGEPRGLVTGVRASPENGRRGVEPDTRELDGYMKTPLRAIGAPPFVNPQGERPEA